MRRSVESGESRLVPLLAAAAGIGLLGMVALWLPLGSTASGPDTTTPPPELAAGEPTTTTAPDPPDTSPATTAPPPASTFPPPHPPEPVRVDTPVGPMVWELRELPAHTSRESYVHATTMRHDGTIVVLGSEQGTPWMAESRTGDRWVDRPVRGLRRGELPWQVTQAGDVLAGVGIGRDGLAVWFERPPGRWEQQAVELPEAPVYWLEPRWILSQLVPVPGGVDLFAGYDGWRVSWDRAIGRPPPPYDYWSFEGGESCGDGCVAGRVLAWSDEMGAPRHAFELRRDGDLLSLVVTDVGGDEVVFEDSVRTSEAQSVFETLASHEHEIGLERSTQLRWHHSGSGGFTLVPDAGLPAAIATFDQHVVHTGDRYLAIESIWGPGNFQPSSRLWASDNAVEWEDVTHELGDPPGELFFIGTRGREVMLLGRSLLEYEIADSVTATATGTIVYSSDGTGQWRAVTLGTAGLTRAHAAAPGPLAWVVTGEECERQCRSRLWMSGDAEHWTVIDLPGRRWLDRGAVVGDDKIVIPTIEQVEDSRTALWVGRLAG